MRMPDIVLQRGFAVVDVSHEAYDWWPGLLRKSVASACVSLRLVCSRTFSRLSRTMTPILADLSTVSTSRICVIVAKMFIDINVKMSSFGFSSPSASIPTVIGVLRWSSLWRGWLCFFLRFCLFWAIALFILLLCLGLLLFGFTLFLRAAALLVFSVLP